MIEIEYVIVVRMNQIRLMLLLKYSFTGKKNVKDEANLISSLFEGFLILVTFIGEMDYYNERMSL